MTGPRQDGLSPPEGHQGRLYDEDAEMVGGWHVFGRGPTAGARGRHEVGGVGMAEVRVYRADRAWMIDIPGGKLRQVLVSDSVMAAVAKRAGSKRR